jgi:replicative DNA helicase
MDLNKIPPQAIDMEEAVLGSMLSESDAVLTVASILKPESFYREAHQKIYQSVVELSKKGFPTDLFSVTEYLRSHNELDAVGGPLYVTNLTVKIVSTANVEYHARIVAQKYLQREIIRISSEVQDKAYDSASDVQELFDYLESELLQFHGMTEKKEAVRLSTIVDTMINTIDKVQRHEIKLIGIPSGFTQIDRKTGGFKNGELIIIAGRPSMGKTAVAIQIALNDAEQNYPVALFSIEMSDEQIAQRCISNATGKTNVQLIEGQCNIDELNEKTEKFLDYKLYVDDSTGLSIYELHAKAKRLVLKYGIKIIIVDYLQLVHGEKKNGSRENEVSSVSRGLKMIAKDLNIPVIALSQLNRELEKTGSKKPQLSNLRESGSIEQDADIVWFIHRPAKYGETSMTINGSERSSEKIAEVIIAKNRNGITGSFFLQHNDSLTEFKDLDECGF